MNLPCVRSIAARSPGAAWQLLTLDEQRRLLVYIEKTKVWAAEPSMDAAWYSTTKHWKGEPTGRVLTAR